MRAPLLLAVLVALAAVLATAGARQGGFVYDDEYYLLQNPAVSGEASPWTTGLGEESQALWRPLTVATWRWQWPESGPASPRPFLTANVGLHAAAALLLMLLARRFGLGLASAALAGLLFAVHPVHAEAVAWISGRSELLACVFVLAAWCWHLTPGRSAALGAAIAVGLAALSKENALIAPALFVTADLWRRRRPLPWGRLGLQAAALAAVWAARASVLTHLFPADDPPFAGLALADRAFVAVQILGRALLLMVWPHPLRVHYHRDELVEVAPGAVAAVVVLAALVLWSWRRRRATGLWLLLIPLSLLPVLNLVPIGETFAERFLYLPSAFACLAVAGGLAAWGRAERRGRGLGASLVVALLLPVAAVPASRAAVAVWRDDLTLWAHAANLRPDDPHARYNHGFFLDAAGRFVTEDRDRPSAGRELSASLRLEPRHRYAGLAHQILGNHALSGLGAAAPNLSAAARHYREALRRLPALGDAAVNLAVVSLAAPELVPHDEARAVLTEALARTDLGEGAREAARELLDQLEASSPPGATGTSSPDGS